MIIDSCGVFGELGCAAPFKPFNSLFASSDLVVKEFVFCVNLDQLQIVHD